MMYSSVYSSDKNGTILNTVGLLPVRCKSHTQLQDATDFCIAYFLFCDLNCFLRMSKRWPLCIDELCIIIHHPLIARHTDIMLASWCIRYADKILQTLNDFLTMSGVTESHASLIHRKSSGDLGGFRLPSRGDSS